MGASLRPGSRDSRRKPIRIAAVCAFAIALAIFAATSALAEGKKDSSTPAAATQSLTAPDPGWTVTVPASVRPGDCLVVALTPADGMKGAAVTLIDADGKELSTAPAFETGTGMLVALIGIPPDAAAGTRTVTTTAILNGAPVVSASPLAVEPGTFAEETIVLDEANTAIKSDFGPKRMEEIRTLNSLLRARAADAPRFAGPFLPPVESTRRTALFGDRRTYAYSTGKKETSIHFGIDYGIKTGTPIFASGAGRVVMARDRVSTGWTVVIEHLPGVYSLYYHCSKLSAREGDLVAAGSEIARSGATGLATGPHLHHEYRVGGIAVSPDWFASRALF